MATMDKSGFYIAVIGPGGVGSIFLSQLAYLQKNHPQGSSIHLVAVLRSKTCILADNGSTLSLTDWTSALTSSTTPTPSPSELTSWLNTHYPSRRSIIVDNTSNQSIANAYPLFLQSGISVVTPNKKAFSSTQDLFNAIRDATFAPPQRISGGLMYHESSVGAGMPIISTLRDLLATGDRVRRIEGVMSGSLSFLFNSFMPLTPAPSDSTKSTPWSSHVATAQRLGYTEPDPRDDLSGLDVARKLVILARVAGVQIAGPDAFPVHSLIPSALASAADADAFLAGLPAHDGEMEDLKRYAHAKGQVLRYVGTADLEKGELRVELVSVGAESPFAPLQGSANVFSFWTERYGDRPLVVIGAGAGGDVTAMGVTSDLIKVIERLG